MVQCRFPTTHIPLSNSAHKAISAAQDDTYKFVSMFEPTNNLSKNRNHLFVLLASATNWFNTRTNKNGIPKRVCKKWL